MIKAKAKTQEGKQVLLFGLSEENIIHLRMKQPILVVGEEMGIPDFDIVIIWGQTEDDIIKELADNTMITDKTKVEDDREISDNDSMQ